MAVTDLASLLDSSASEAERRAAFRVALADRGAEFIDGRVVVHPPVPARDLDPAARILLVLDTHVRIRRLGWVGFGKALVALTRNDYEPDVCFFGRDKAEAIRPDTLEFPAPDLAVEVLSPSTERRDRGIKFEDYAAHGVDEYWIVDATAEAVEQYLLEGSAYGLAIESGTGELRSRAVEGFAVPVRAVFDDAVNLDALRTILA